MGDVAAAAIVRSRSGLAMNPLKGLINLRNWSACDPEDFKQVLKASFLEPIDGKGYFNKPDRNWLTDLMCEKSV
ncbi:MAG: hypothetical protein V3T17_08830 [Pseudomonadales bacterium]